MTPNNSTVTWHNICTAPLQDDILGWDRNNGTYVMYQMRRKQSDKEVVDQWFERLASGRCFPECWAEFPQPVHSYDVDGVTFIDVD